MDNLAAPSQNTRIVFQSTEVSRNMALMFVSGGLIFGAVNYHCPPRVRDDYLLLITIGGTAWVQEGARKRQLKDGDCILLRPGIPHEYGNLTAWSFLYLHVGGDRIETTLSQLGFFKRQNIGFRLRSSRVVNWMRTILNSGSLVTPSAELMRNAMFLQILVALHEDYAEDRTRRDRLAMVCEQIDQRLTEKMTLADLAKTAGMSTFHFCRSFRDITGLSPMQYVQRRRIEKASRILQESPDIKIGDVAEMVGFTDHLYFSRVFRKWIGITPIQCRNEQ